MYKLVVFAFCVGLVLALTDARSLDQNEQTRDLDSASNAGKELVSFDLIFRYFVVHMCRTPRPSILVFGKNRG